MRYLHENIFGKVFNSFYIIIGMFQSLETLFMHLISSFLESPVKHNALENVLGCVHYNILQSIDRFSRLLSVNTNDAVFHPLRRANDN